MRKHLKKLAASLTLSFALVAGVGVHSADSAPTAQTVNAVAALKTLDGKECIKRPAGTEPVAANDASVCVEVGTTMPDGSIFAGITADGKQRIYAMPDDLDVTMSFNDAAKAVKKLNKNKSHGHDDWRIPSREHLRVLYNNQTKSALNGTFNTSSDKESGSDFPDWYWSSTESRDDSSYVHIVRFSDGNAHWNHQDFTRLSCRPVRLVEASVSVPAPR